MGKAKMMTNLPVISGHISANDTIEGALPVKFRLQLADACPPLWCKKKDFRDSNANSTKTAYYSQKGFAVHGWFS